MTYCQVYLHCLETIKSLPKQQMTNIAKPTINDFTQAANDKLSNLSLLSKLSRVYQRFKWQILSYLTLLSRNYKFSLVANDKYCQTFLCCRETVKSR